MGELSEIYPRVHRAIAAPWEPKYTRGFAWVIPPHTNLSEVKVIIRVNSKQQREETFNATDIKAIAKWINSQTKILRLVMPGVSSDRR